MQWIDFPPPVKMQATEERPGEAPRTIMVDFTTPQFLVTEVMTLAAWRASRENVAAHIRIMATLDTLKPKDKGMPIAESDQPILWRIVQEMDLRGKPAIAIRCMPMIEAIACASTMPTDEETKKEAVAERVAKRVARRLRDRG